MPVLLTVDPHGRHLRSGLQYRGLCLGLSFLLGFQASPSVAWATPLCKVFLEEAEPFGVAKSSGVPIDHSTRYYYAGRLQLKIETFLNTAEPKELLRDLMYSSQLNRSPWEIRR